MQHTWMYFEILYDKVESVEKIYIKLTEKALSLLTSFQRRTC